AHTSRPPERKNGRPRRPPRPHPSDGRTADPAEQEAAAEQAAGPAALAAGHGAQEQGLGADAEHRRTHPAAAAQHHELHEGPGEPGQDAAHRDHRDARRHHARLAEAVHQAARRQRADHPHQCEHADHAGRRGDAHTKLTGEEGDGGRDDPEPECDRKRHRSEDRHFGGQIVERASLHATHEMALCQVTRWYQSGHGTRKRRPGLDRPAGRLLSWGGRAVSGGTIYPWHRTSHYYAASTSEAGTRSRWRTCARSWPRWGTPG